MIKKIIIFIVLSNAIFKNCKEERPILQDVYNEDEVEVIYKIIEYFDSFVFENSSEKLTIDKAYINFLNNYAQMSIDKGDLSVLVPSKKNRLVLYNKLDSITLSRICCFKDYKISNDSMSSNTSINDVYFYFNSDSKFLKLTEKLSKKNKFFEVYHHYLVESGSFSPSIYNLLLTNYNEINFEKEEERLLFILPILFF